MKNIYEFCTQNLSKEKILSICLALILIILFRICSSGIAYLVIKIFRPKSKEKVKITDNIFYKLIQTIATFIGIYLAVDIIKEPLEIGPEVLVGIYKILRIIMIALVAKVLSETVTAKNRLMQKAKSKKDENTAKAVAKIYKIVIYVIAAFMIISELDYDLSGLITGVGLGGVILTLAAQDTVKSLLGGLAIIVDKPFKVGDYIKVLENEGTVEEIKFRSTSIRTLENSVLHIPNSEMASASIINLSELQKRRYSTTLVIELNTKLEKVEKVKQRIYQMLLQKEEIIKDTIIIRFNQIAENGMDILVVAYIDRTKFTEFLKVKEEINYEIMSILREEKVELAYNTQTVYVKK